MLLLLHVQHGPVLEGPLHDVGFWGCTFDVVGFGQLGPEFVEVLQFDHVPDLGEGGGDDGGFADGGGCWDAGGHFFLEWWWVLFVGWW